MGKITMDKARLKEVLEKHAKWLREEVDGERADLSVANLRGADLGGADLRDADLRGANMRDADLSGANMARSWLSGADLSNADLSDANLRDADMGNAGLRGANMRDADLRGANMRDADMGGADLRYANMRDADLSNADLSDANLRDADLSNAGLRGANMRDADLRGANIARSRLNGADLSNVKADSTTAFYGMVCPEKGAFIGYKKLRGDYIAELLIPEAAKRSSATTRHCRCSEAKVLSITRPDGTKAVATTVSSLYYPAFVYCVGETVKANAFDADRWNEHASGIHFFITRDEAVRY